MWSRVAGVSHLQQPRRVPVRGRDVEALLIQVEVDPGGASLMQFAYRSANMAV